MLQNYAKQDFLHLTENASNVQKEHIGTEQIV